MKLPLYPNYYPTREDILFYINRHKDNHIAMLKDEILCRRFSQLKQDSSLDEMDLMETCTLLNAYYNTQIFEPHYIVRHLCNPQLHLLERIHQGDPSIVNAMACTEVPQKGEVKTKNFYSFSSKFCRFANPDSYPIYDRLVEQLLMAFIREGIIVTNKKPDFRDYVQFKDVVDAFRSHYGVEDIPYFELDYYFWELSKELETIYAPALSVCKYFDGTNALPECQLIKSSNEKWLHFESMFVQECIRKPDGERFFNRQIEEGQALIKMGAFKTFLDSYPEKQQALKAALMSYLDCQSGKWFPYDGEDCLLTY